jgi:hypothetical protein
MRYEPGFLRSQRELNLGSAEMWSVYAGHRRSVTDLMLSLRAAGKKNSRLVVLGAGNCNDLELEQLFAAFTEIHLVDIDHEALADGVQRQQAPVGNHLVLHGGVDIMNLPQQTADRLAEADVVVSTTILTQLIDFSVQAGRDSPDQLLAIRDAHLHLVAGLLAPGGFGVIISDVVSSDTCLPLSSREVDLDSLLIETVNSGNFFTGTNPFAIKERIAAVLGYPPRSIGVKLPWKWDIGRRSYLVCAVVFRNVQGPTWVTLRQPRS